MGGEGAPLLLAMRARRSVRGCCEAPTRGAPDRLPGTKDSTTGTPNSILDPGPRPWASSLCAPGKPQALATMLPGTRPTLSLTCSRSPAATLPALGVACTTPGRLIRLRSTAKSNATRPGCGIARV